MSEAAILDQIRDVVSRGRRFLITSHARPDGDAIGSQVALALALRTLGKDVRIVNRDPVPEPYRALPGADSIEIAEAVEGRFDAAFILECGDLSRPGVAGLSEYLIVNIDHHLGNTGYGAINWFDESAAACGELIVDLIDALQVPLNLDIATEVYVAILTDTGSFRHSNITARTFEICRRAAEAGVDAAAVARQVFDSHSIGKLKLMGALLADMRLEADGRLAVLRLDEALLQETGSSRDDVEGLINLPLAARDVLAVVMFKSERQGETRVSLRSKGSVDVRAVAARYGGGGHTNAAGFTAPGPYADIHARVVHDATEAIALAATHGAGSA